MIDPALLATLATLIMIFFSILDSVVNFGQKYPRLLTFLVVAGIILLGFTFYWTSKKTKSNLIRNRTITSKIDNGIKISQIGENNILHIPLEEKGSSTPLEEEPHHISIKNGAIKVESHNLMTYEKFKSICFSEEFMKDMLNSIVLNLKEKDARYAALYDKIEHEYNIAKKHSGTSIVPRPDSETTNALKSTLSEINEIRQIIKEKSENLTLRDVETNLNIILYHKEHGLEHLIGRQEIKDFLAVRLYTFSKNPKVFFSSFQHILLYAPPGYGKTKIASVISHVYGNSGILIRDNCMQVTKSAFVTPYMNHSGTKTKNVLLSTLESVLFIDEAYDLGPSNMIVKDHTGEAITEMVNFIDKFKGFNVIIAAGYKEDMKRFTGSNQGIPRRFPYEITLLEYSAKELTMILLNMLASANSDVSLTQSDRNYLYSLVNGVNCKDPSFFKEQGGAMNNLSSEILHAYYSVYNSTVKQAINNGLNNYLALKNKHVLIDTVANDDLIDINSETPSPPPKVTKTIPMKKNFASKMVQELTELSAVGRD